jgi:dTDP-4-dehydrorhamnose reductase
MRLLIAGWQGQLARAFVDAAPARSDIVALALGRPALDLCEVRAIERALSEDRPNVVINTAGYTAVDKAEDEPERAVALNRDGARLLAKVAAERGVPIIHMSTSNVFGGEKEAPYVETDAAAPINVYGRSKLEGEADVRAANPRHIILRTSWIFSPFGGNFISEIVQKARRGEPLRIVTESAPVWGTYHIANAGGPATWHAAAQQACRAAGLDTAAEAITPITSGELAKRAPRPRNSSLDTSYLASHLGLTLRDWRAALADAVAALSTPS